jgi:hypothetical protein
MLGQTVFELLSWFLLVEEDRMLSADGYHKLQAADSLRLLLYRSDIPPDLPSTLVHLQEIARARNLVDGPQVLTEFRNAVVHPDRKNLDRLRAFPPDARREARSLGLRYLELILLHLFGYDGFFFDCTLAGHGNYLVPVPWSSADN